MATVDMTAVLAEFGKLRDELGAKLDDINARLQAFVLKSDHEEVRKDLEERVRKLESFRAWAIGAMATIGVGGTVVGSILGWVLRAFTGK